MKTIITMLLIAVCFTASAQKYQPNIILPTNMQRCGTWEEQPSVLSDWITVDTLGNHHINSIVRQWVYDEERMVTSNITLANYCPCGCGYPIVYKQYRVCALTGIRQLRTRIINYKYIPPAKTEYQSVLDSLKARIPKTFIIQ